MMNDRLELRIECAGKGAKGGCLGQERTVLHLDFGDGYTNLYTC